MPRLRRRLGRVLAIGGLLVVLPVTLSPVRGPGGNPVDFWCLICGIQGFSDGILNVVLFAPLGAGLFLLGGPGRALLGTAAVSLGIELLQSGVPGRFPSLGDVLFNTLGGGLGVVLGWTALHLRLCRICRSPWARAALILFPPFTFAVTAVLFRPVFPDAVYYGQWTHRLGRRLPAYRGQVLSAFVGDLPLPDLRLPDQEAVRRALESGDRFSLKFVTGPAPRRLSHLFAIYDDASREVLFIGVRGRDLVFRRRTRAAEIALSQPWMRWSGILAPFPADTVNLFVEQRGSRLCVSLEEETRCDLAPGAEAGWTLLFNRGGMPPLAAILLGGAWLFLLAVPAGVATRTPGVAAAVGSGASVAYGLISWGVPWMAVHPPYFLLPLLGALAGNRVRRSGRTLPGTTEMEDTRKDRLRIAYLANFAPAKMGTGETRIISLARAARERGQIFCHEPIHPSVRDALARAGASVESLNELGRRFFTGIRRFAREFDVIQLNLIPPRGRLAMMAYAARPSVVLFLDHVSGPPGSQGAQRRPLPLRILDRATMFRVHQVAGVSDYVRRRARDRFHLREARTLTLYGGVDPGRFSPDRPIAREEGPLRICTVAALIPEKGVGTLLEAVSRLTMKDWTLSVAGEGPEEGGLKALAIELGIADKVSFLGSRDDVPALLEGSDVFVHPAIWEEALGYTVLEGLAAGCAVVASRVGGIPERGGRASRAPR